MFTWIRLMLFVGGLAVLPACQITPSHAPADTPPADVQTITEHWPDGGLRLERHVLRLPDGTFQDHGLYTCWYPSGQKEYEGLYVSGQLHGVEVRWHDNGQKAVEQHWDHGVRHGPRYNWDPQGRLRKEEFYVNDRPDGTWTVYKDNGEVKWQQKFRAGNPLP